jgi:GxxExxY protein
MPVECSVEFERIGQDQFHALDKRVMGHAFDIHNTMGRFFDERIYQEELAQRCRSDGMAVDREVHLRVVHRDFSKSYFLDMLIDCGGLYELKTVGALNPSHDSQVINYLLLAGLKHGKLVNMRPPSVETRFVSTALSPADRLVFELQSQQFEEVDDVSGTFLETLLSLLKDWGVFLSAELYREALVHFFNGADAGICPVNVISAGKVVGSQKLCVLDPQTAWHVSAIRNNHSFYETHMLRLLKHTDLKRIHWVNFDHRNVSLQTIKK